MTLAELLEVLVQLDVEEGLGEQPIYCERQEDGTFWLVIGDGDAQVEVL